MFCDAESDSLGGNDHGGEGKEEGDKLGGVSPVSQIQLVLLGFNATLK